MKKKSEQTKHGFKQAKDQSYLEGKTKPSKLMEQLVKKLKMILRMKGKVKNNE